MRAALILLASMASPATALAGDLTVTGKLGFMDEWEVVATVREGASGDRAEFAGPLTLRHTGLCTVNGPVEKSGDIRVRRGGLVWSTMEATLVFDGKQCAFSARGAKSYEGTLRCPGGGIPLRLQIN